MPRIKHVRLKPEAPMRDVRVAAEREKEREREAKRGAGPPPRAIWSDDPMRGPRVKPRLVLRSYITDAVL
jgi:hypothetical protein